MRGVRISGLELDSDGSIAVEKLADIFEDGEVTGTSYLASSLRKSVAERGPTPLSTIIRRFNNGYFGASWMYKGRVYLQPGEKPPEGYGVHEGPRGGKYYDTKRGRGRPRRTWVVGDEVQINNPALSYHRAKGKIVRLETTAEDKSNDPRDIAVVDVTMPDGEIQRRFIALFLFAPPGKKLPEKNREMQRRKAMHDARDKVRDNIAARIKRFREARFDRNEMWYIKVSPYESESFGMTIDKTDEGLEIWSPIEGQERDVSEAPDLDVVLKSISYMAPKAIRDLNNYVRRIVLSPIRNPKDREMSKATGTNFTSAGTMNMKERELILYPTVRERTTEGVASILTHEVGHAADAFRESIVTAYNDKRSDFWDTQEHMPVTPEGERAVEEKHGIPPHPNDWMRGYSTWRDFDLGTKNPDIVRFWGWFPRGGGHAVSGAGDGLMIGEKSWNDCSPVEKTIISREARRSEPVSEYARTNDREYYAEAYENHRFGNIPKNHTMRTHFKNMERIWKWLSAS